MGSIFSIDGHGTGEYHLCLFVLRARFKDIAHTRNVDPCPEKSKGIQPTEKTITVMACQSPVNAGSRLVL